MVLPKICKIILKDGLFRVELLVVPYPNVMPGFGEGVITMQMFMPPQRFIVILFTYQTPKSVPRNIGRIAKFS